VLVGVLIGAGLPAACGRRIRTNTFGESQVLGEAVHRIVLTGDVDVSGMLEDDAKIRMRKIVYDVFGAGFEAAGVRPGDRDQEDRGDGILAAVAPGVPAGRMLGPWVQAAYWKLHALNQGLQVPVRLRVALHVGPVRRDSNGLVGRAVDLTCRLCDCPEAKAVLRGAGGSNLLLVVSDVLHESVRGGGDQIERENFVRAAVSTKEGDQVAWFHLPGRATPPVGGSAPPGAVPPGATPAPPAAVPDGAVATPAARASKYAITVQDGDNYITEHAVFNDQVHIGGRRADR
jgi:hypothetical protein